MGKKSAAAVAAGLAIGALARAGDLTLVVASLLTAGGAVGFAGYMTLAGNGATRVNGMQYLAIFAQPSHPHRTEGVDMNPTGAITHNAQENVAGYSLVGAEPRFAWLREGDRIFAVRPGDDVNRLGRVETIEPRDGRWALIGGKGAVLIVSSKPELATSTGSHFGKPMIFGETR